MSADAPDELKGWPESWYAKDDKGKVYLRCPAPNCKDVFKNADEMENRLMHQFCPEDPVTKFQHAILQATCEVKQCPKCDYVRTPRDMGPWTVDSDIRALLKHEHDEHNGEQDLLDMKKMIGFIRKHRGRLFGGKDLTRAIRLWKHVDSYFRTNIKQQPEFAAFETYLLDVGVWMGEGDWLGDINKACRDTQFPGNPQGKELKECRDYYPVGPEYFLQSLNPPKQRLGDSSNIREIMRAKYAAGDF